MRWAGKNSIRCFLRMRWVTDGVYETGVGEASVIPGPEI